jgi:hypothetical protein
VIYFARISSTSLKIGFTVDQDLTTRMRRLSSGYGHRVELLAFMEGGRDVERLMHERFSNYRLGKPEHFRLAPEILGFVGHPLLMEMPDGSAVKPTHLEGPSSRSVA